MIRQKLRRRIRLYADELDEAPQGLFDNDDLNDMINTAQEVVELILQPFIPWYFRGTKLISLTVNKSSYSITSDLSISDLLIFENILHNKADQKPFPLRFCMSPEELADIGISVGQTGAPRAWGYEDRDNIWIAPTPAATESNRLRGVYSKKVPDLNHDTSDAGSDVATPHLPPSLHVLIAIQVVMDWFIRDERGSDMARMQGLFNSKMESGLRTLSAKQGFTTGRLLGGGRIYRETE